MSAPPPGGSPPPQSPPPYPQSPQPPQGYPPPYPPQQPYYAPAAPPPKKNHTALIIVLVVLIVVVVLVVTAWWVLTSILTPVTNATNITITSVSFTIPYVGSVQYFGPSPVTACSECPLHGTLTHFAQYNLTLTNSDTSTHNVTAVTLSGLQFALVSTNPTFSSASPLAFAAHQTRVITLTITGTGLSGNNVLMGTISTN